MIEGKVKLELFDGLTGKCQEKIENHNMMTGAIDKIVKFTMGYPSFSDQTIQGILSLRNPFTQHLNLLTGLCMFDSPIPENTNQVWLPAGVKATAYGVVGIANAEDAQRQLGTYNTTESDTSQTLVKKYVWDWQTQQGNGVVSSLALTHRNAGFFGFGSNQGLIDGTNRNTQKTFGCSMIFPETTLSRVSRATGIMYRGTVNSSYVDFCIDSENDWKYMFRVDSDCLRIVKHSMHMKHFDIFRSASHWQEYTEVATINHSFSGTTFAGFYNTDEKALYFWLDAPDNFTNGASRQIYKYDMETQTLTEHGVFVNHVDGLRGQGCAGYLVITNSAVYTQYSSPYDQVIYKYNFATGTTTLIPGQPDVTWSGTGGSSVYSHKAFILNGIITFIQYIQYRSGNNISRNILLDTSDDSIRYTCNMATGSNEYYTWHSETYQLRFIPPYDNTQMIFGSAGTDGDFLDGVLSFDSLDNMDIQANTFTLTNYLGTIFNLSEAVTKTAQQTMKLTYTLTAHEEEGE